MITNMVILIYQIWWYGYDIKYDDTDMISNMVILIWNNFLWWFWIGLFSIFDYDCIRNVMLHMLSSIHKSLSSKHFNSWYAINTSKTIFFPILHFSMFVQTELLERPEIHNKQILNHTKIIQFRHDVDVVRHQG